MNTVFLHELPDAKSLFEVVAKERQLLPSIIEKDYWLMHCLWGIQQQRFAFELKGGTSLSKGFDIIERFSEDIDIQIHPQESDNIKIGKHHDKQTHIESRANFFDKIAQQLAITGLKFHRDHSFDEKLKMRSAGIRGEYTSIFTTIPSLKDGIVLELGFDQTTPNLPRDITSWAYEKAQQFNLPIIDNRPKQVKCYTPEYTLVEKLQTVSTKYRLQQENKAMPINFLRHYYDIYKLLENDKVLKFIGSDEYQTHKKKRFRMKDEKNISKNPAFSIPDVSVRALYCKEFKNKSAIYFGNQPNFDVILQKIADFSQQL